RAREDVGGVGRGKSDHEAYRVGGICLCGNRIRCQQDDQYGSYFHFLNPPKQNLLAPGPVTGLAPMMGKRNNTQFFASDVVNDAVGKSAQREAAPASPRRPSRGYAHRSSKSRSNSTMNARPRSASFASRA